MRRPTWDWTDRHFAVAGLVVGVAIASLAGLTEPAPIPLWVALAVALCAITSLITDAYGGLVIALACASGLVGVRRLTDHWAAENFSAALVETAALLAVGALAGGVGKMLRVRSDSPASWSMLEPAYGSLGLLGADAAHARLEEEVERAHAHRRPLSLAIFEVLMLDDGLSEQGQAAAMRAVARIVESRAGETDVPFALTTQRFGVILPEASSARAWESIGATLHGIADARFTFGTERAQRSVADVVEVHVGITQLGRGRDTAQGLLDAATVAAERSAMDAKAVG